MSFEHEILFNLAEKAASMPDGVKFCGILRNAEVWLVKDKAVEEFLRGPSALPSPSEAIEAARKQARVELRDRFAVAALTGLLADHTMQNFAVTEFADLSYEYADAMLKARGDE